MIREATKKLIEGHALSEPEIEATACLIMDGEASPVQIAAFLTALHMAGETVDCLTAFARVLRSHALPFRAPEGVVLDTCGTGGDSSGTFNISTAAAFVAAGAGVRVAKHGNRSMTSKCGSADVLAELGVRIDSDVSVMERALHETGICFLFAQSYHSSMKHVADVRRQLGFRTIFNLLGPLVNPAGATHQLIGVFRADLVGTHAAVLKRLGSRRALVVHGDDGLDEMTTTSATSVAELKDGVITLFKTTPEQLKIARGDPAELAGGDPACNARIIREILSGTDGPRTDIVTLNAGAAIYVAGKAATLEEGVACARAAIRSGAALDRLERLCSMTS